MIRINLLPYREERRKVKRQQFYTLLATVAILALCIVFAGRITIQGFITKQEESNEILRSAIRDLNRELDEIRRLQGQIQALLSRKQIIESLQHDRSEAVRLLTELTKQMPTGVYIRSFRQDGIKVTMNGVAQSNARVSLFMSNLESSQWLERPQLIEIRAIPGDRRRLNEFNMNVWLRREAPIQQGGGRQ